MKQNKKVIIASAIVLVLLLGIGTVCLVNHNKDKEVANTESEEILASAEIDVSDVDLEVKEPEETESPKETPEPTEAPKETEAPAVEETSKPVVTETTEAKTLEETPTPTASEPPKTVPANADAYVPYDAGKTYTVDSANTTVQVTVPARYELPYIVNGIDIRSGDTDGDGVNDNHQNTWYGGATFTASNGVTIRIADGFKIIPGDGNIYSIFYDRTENCEPGSDWDKACNEYMGTSKTYEVSASNLPAVATVSSKQTVIDDTNSSFVAYKQAFDPLWAYQNTGSATALSCLQPYDGNQDGVVDGIGLLDTSGGATYIWTMDYDAANGYWKFTIKGNYTELIWNSILNSLRMITPDADAVYNEIYQAFYYGDTLLVQNYEQWVTVGSTQLYATGETGRTYIYIK